MAAPNEAKDPRFNSNWGTIIEPPFAMGTQKLESGQIAEITDRLHTTEIKVMAIVERLSLMTKPPPESKRIGAIENEGILNSYAWKGWKTSDSLHQQPTGI